MTSIFVVAIYFFSARKPAAMNLACAFSRREIVGAAYAAGKLVDTA